MTPRITAVVHEHVELEDGRSCWATARLEAARPRVQPGGEDLASRLVVTLRATESRIDVLPPGWFWHG